MVNWQRKPLKEVVTEWYRGSTPSRTHTEYYMKQSAPRNAWGIDGPAAGEPDKYTDDKKDASCRGIPWVRASDINGGVLTETELSLTEEGAAQIRGWVPEGAVLLSASGTIGKVAVAGRRMKLNQAVQAMVFDETVVLADYAYYYFQFFRPWLEGKANTVTIPNLTRAQLERTAILFPCLAEQKQIIAVMRRAEAMVRKQKDALKMLERLLYGSIYREAGRCRMKLLEDYLAEPVLAGPALQTEEGLIDYHYINTLSGRQWSMDKADDYPLTDGTNAYLQQYTLKKGDILVGRYQPEGEECCLLITEDMDNAVFGNQVFRVRAREESMEPELLLANLRFHLKYLEWSRTRLSPVSIASVNVPEFSPEYRKRFSAVMRRALALQRKILDMEGLMERFYRAALACACTAGLTQGFRFAKGLEEPDRTFILNHYYATKLERISGEGTELKTEWDRMFGSKEQQALSWLSDFQRAIWRKYMEAGEPLPIHVIFKRVRKENRLRRKNYSIQDAIAAAKILTGLGFLEETVPEKIYFDESEITDQRGKTITIRRYQASRRDA